MCALAWFISFSENFFSGANIEKSALGCSELDAGQPINISMFNVSLYSCGSQRDLMGLLQYTWGLTQKHWVTKSYSERIDMGTNLLCSLMSTAYRLWLFLVTLHCLDSCRLEATLTGLQRYQCVLCPLDAIWIAAQANRIISTASPPLSQTNKHILRLINCSCR